MTTYKVITRYYDIWGTFMEKEEETISREQAFGAASIYMMDPECESCYIYQYLPDSSVPRKLLTYHDR